jgi:sporulation protein YlmC with PRC-barrel domain
MASAIAALLASPAWAADDRPGGPSTMPRDDTGRSMEDMPMGGESGRAGSDAASSRNPLYSRTPVELEQEEVVDITGTEIGTVKKVVTSHGRTSAHVVISSGGILGIGASKIAVPLDELQPLGDKLQLNDTKESLEARTEYTAEEYLELDPDRPISEFSAFEPSADESGSAPAPQ